MNEIVEEEYRHGQPEGDDEDELDTDLSAAALAFGFAGQPGESSDISPQRSPSPRVAENGDVPSSSD